MNCCQHCAAIEDTFDHKGALKQLRRYQKKGPEKTTRVLVEALTRLGVEGLSLIDVGGGIGAVQHELLRAGVVHSRNVDASSGYISACKEGAEALGHSERITHVHGNFADMRDLEPADIVTHERVICCYPDMPGLVRQSCEKAGRYVGIVYPIDNWLVKLIARMGINLGLQVWGNDFRVFVHSTEEIDGIITAHGFTQRFYQRVFPWQVVVYGKSL